MAVVTPPVEAPAKVEPRLAADQAIAATEPTPVTAVDARTKQIDTMIVGSFDAIRADDAGWLSGAHSAKVEEAVAVVEEGDGPGPNIEEPAAAPIKTRVAAARSTADGDAAVAAIAALEQPVKPVARPEPLTVTAFAEAPKGTATEVAAAAKKQLAAVADKKPVAQAKATVAAATETKPAEALVTKVADIATGDTRTVAGSGVNVRSGPGKSTDKLFALAGGEKVKLGESQHGWFKITDDQGRTGWIYKSYLN